MFEHNLTIYSSASLLAAILILCSSLLASGNTLKAVAVMNGTAGVDGIVRLQQENECSTTILVNLSGLTPGKHGFHLHEFGDLTNGCISAGGHYNPKNVTHGGPNDLIRHVGDLGNVEADSNGNVATTIVDSQIALYGKFSSIGRTFVVHELKDDLGRGGNSTSKITGNAGGRLACGIVGWASDN